MGNAAGIRQGSKRRSSKDTSQAYEASEQASHEGQTEPALQRSSSPVLEGTVQRIECGRCTTVSTVPCGCEIFQCPTCGASVRVQLGAVSKHVRDNVESRAKAAEQEIVNVMEQQAKVSWGIWQEVADEMVLQEVLWSNEELAPECAAARLRLREALATGQPPKLASVLSDTETHLMPLMSSSAKLTELLSRARHEEDLEVVWRCLLQALRSRDRTEVEFWQREGAGHGLVMPPIVEEVLSALKSEERARLAELEYQQKIYSKVQQAFNTKDEESLTKLLQEMRVLGMDSSSADAALAALKAESPAKNGSARPVPTPKVPPRPTPTEQGGYSSSTSAKGTSSNCNSSPAGTTAQGPAQATSQPPQSSEQSMPSTSQHAKQSQPPPQTKHEEDPLKKESIATLKARLAELGVPCHGICEKDELVRLLKIAQQKRSSTSSSSTSAGSTARPKSSSIPQAGAGPFHYSSREKTEPPPRRSGAMTRDAAIACLGLPSNPGDAETKKAYRQAALRWHPDRRQNHGCEEEAKRRFQEAKEAFDLLQRT